MIFLRNIAVIFFACVCSILAHAQPVTSEPADKQEVAAAFQKACAWFISTPSYYFKLKYVSYGDHVTRNPIESSEGYYKRVTNNYITETVGLKTTQNENLKIVIDTADRIVTVMNPGNLSPVIADTEDLETLLGKAKALKKMKQGKSTRYRIDFNKNDLYDAYEFIINDKGLILGLTYYYSEQIEKADQESGSEKTIDIKMKPRLEISFLDYQVPAKFTESEFNERDVLTINKGKINLTPSYKEFRLLDYRVQALQKQKK